MAGISSILEGLAVKFAEVEERNAVDEAMIDALVAASAELTAGATALKSITYTAP